VATWLRADAAQVAAGTAGTTGKGVGILTERVCAEANTDKRVSVINRIKRAKSRQSVRAKVETTKERTQARAYQVIDAFKGRKEKRKEGVDGKKAGPMWASMRIMYQGGWLISFSTGA
jgi:Mg-chelatase subunit ChlI